MVKSKGKTFIINVVGWEDGIYSGSYDFSNASATTVPMAPSDLVVISGSAVLTWSDNSNNETGFVIERSTDGITYTQYYTASADAEGYTDTSVNAGNDYWYRVFAFNSAGSSSYSNTASISFPLSLTSNLLAYWNFDQADGADEPDLVGGIGTLSQVTSSVVTVGSDAAGPGGHFSRTFSDSDVNALVVNTTAGGTFPLSINWWMRIDAIGASGALPFNYNEITTWGPPLSAYSYNGTFYATMKDDAGKDVVYLNSGTDYGDHTWHMWTYVVDDSLNFKVYVDGVLQSWTDVSSNPPLSGTSVNTFDSISFGRSIYLGSLNPSDGFAGLISLAGIWNRALTSTDITQLYNGSSGLSYAEL